jgi:hypothetical protein
MAQVLTAKELAVFAAMIDCAMDCAGGDFGIMDEVDYERLGLTGQQFGALVTSIQQKGCVQVYEPHKVNGEHWVTQFTVNWQQPEALWKRPEDRCPCDSGHPERCPDAGMA